MPAPTPAPARNWNPFYETMQSHSIRFRLLLSKGSINGWQHLHSKELLLFPPESFIVISLQRRMRCIKNKCIMECIIHLNPALALVVHREAFEQSREQSEPLQPHFRSALVQLWKGLLLLACVPWILYSIINSEVFSVQCLDFVYRINQNPLAEEDSSGFPSSLRSRNWVINQNLLLLLSSGEAKRDEEWCQCERHHGLHCLLR